jgi:hypothetical protein
MIHGALEAAMAGEPYPELRVYIQPVLEWKEKTGIQIVDREIRLVNKAEGFAGTADVLFRYGQQGIGILDYKTRKTKARAKSSRLTTTRRCSWRRMPRPTGGRRTSTGCWPPTCSSRPPSPAGWKWSSTGPRRDWQAFRMVAALWRYQKGYDPRPQSSARPSHDAAATPGDIVDPRADTPTRASWASVSPSRMGRRVGPIVAVDFETFYTTYSVADARALGLRATIRGSRLTWWP